MPLGGWNKAPEAGRLGGCQTRELEAVEGKKGTMSRHRGVLWGFETKDSDDSTGEKGNRTKRTRRWGKFCWGGGKENSWGETRRVGGGSRGRAFLEKNGRKTPRGEGGGVRFSWENSLEKKQDN